MLNFLYLKNNENRFSGHFGLGGLQFTYFYNGLGQFLV